MVFERSKFMKRRHEQARIEKSAFDDKFKQNSKYSDFLRRDTPLSEKLITYEVSYQVSYMGKIDTIETTSNTFMVTGYMGEEANIEEKTMNMILDSRGKSTGSNFMPSALDKIKTNTSITVLPRGMETSERKPDKNDVQNVAYFGLSVKNLDTTMNFKNKKKREGVMTLDTSHFYR